MVNKAIQTKMKVILGAESRLASRHDVTVVLCYRL